jgi:hypothetical protein
MPHVERHEAVRGIDGAAARAGELKAALYPDVRRTVAARREGYLFTVLFYHFFVVHGDFLSFFLSFF